MAKRPSLSRDLDSCNLFVKYLPAHLTDDDLNDLFKDFGEIVSSKIMVDQTSGKSLGYGFVRYRSSDQAALAIDKMNGTKVSTKRLLCKLANHSSTTSPNQFSGSQASSSSTRTSPRNQTPSNNLYIRPLLPNTTEDHLRKLFGAYGTVVDAKVMIDRNTGQSRLIGFVRFETESDASLAMKELQGHVLAESAAPLQIKYADSERQKEQRRARNQMQQNQMMAYPPGSPVGIQYWPVPVGAPPVPWWMGQPGASPPPGLPPYPAMPPGWPLPPYGLPMAGFGPPLGQTANEGASNSSAAPGGEANPSFSPEFSHVPGTPNDPSSHFSSHLLPAHLLSSPPMMPYDPLMMQMQSLSLSSSGHTSNLNYSGQSHANGGETLSASGSKRHNGPVVGAGGEVVDS